MGVGKGTTVNQFLILYFVWKIKKQFACTWHYRDSVRNFL